MLYSNSYREHLEEAVARFLELPPPHVVRVRPLGCSSSRVVTK